jgi:hypothetical protein
MKSIVFCILLLFYSHSSWSDCGSNSSNSQSIYKALSEFGLKNNIASDELYDLKMKIQVKCAYRTRLSTTIYNSLPDVIKEEIGKEKNIKKLKKYLQDVKDEVIASIEDAEIEIDGQKFSGLVTESGKIIINDDPENSLNSLSFDSKFLEKEGNAVTLRGNLGSVDNVQKKKAQPFRFTINRARLNEGFGGVLSNKKFRERAALGIIKIKGRGASNRFTQKFDAKYSLLEDKAYIRAALIDFNCPKNICINAKTDLDFSSGSLVHRTNLSTCNPKNTTNVCIGVATTNDGLVGFGNLSYETKNKSLDAKFSYSEKRKNLDLGLSSRNYKGYVRSRRSNEQTDSGLEYTKKVDEIGFGFNNNDPYSLSYALTYKDIENQQENNRVIYFGVSGQFK